MGEDPYVLVEFADQSVPKNVRYISFLAPYAKWKSCTTTICDGEDLRFFILTKGTHYSDDYVIDWN